MAIPGLPRGKKSQLFRAVVALWKANPVLDGVVRTWLAFDGSSSGAGARDETPVSSLEPVSASACPWVRLSLAPRRVVEADSASYAFPVAIRMELAVAGEDVADLADLYEAFLAATRQFAPSVVGGSDVANYLRNESVTILGPDGSPLPQPQGATEWHFEDMAVDPDPTRHDPAMCVGVGTFVLTARVPT